MGSKVGKERGIMTKLFCVILILASFIVMTGIGCGDKEQKIDCNQLLAEQLATPRKLQKLFEVSEEVKGSSSQWSGGGGFFLFFGGAGARGSSQTWDYTQYSVMLAFEKPDMPDVYAIVKIPLNRINVKLGENVNSTVSFYFHHIDGEYNPREKVADDCNGWCGWSSFSEMYYQDMEGFFNIFLAYAVVETTRDMWPKYIEMPLNNPDFYQ